MEYCIYANRMQFLLFVGKKQKYNTFFFSGAKKMALTPRVSEISITNSS